ncbi:flagellar protein FlgN [Thioclava sp. 15-R06ZXC-3]|uniref:Flagellar protein FlgN n=1 Tax=Thioclava arctica TaxID=3238301 RepID=A0ABV3TIU2_9RHOB
MAQTEEDKTTALIDLLRLERDAIRAGDFSALIEIADRKEALIADLAGSSPARLDELRVIAADNQRLLAAALEGVRAAQRRLNAILSASKGFNAYDKSGQVKPIRRGDGSLEHRV